MGFGHEIEPLECWSLSHDAILPKGRDGRQDPGERIHRNLVTYVPIEGVARELAMKRRKGKLADKAADPP
jgi:hypothetical protein